MAFFWESKFEYLFLEEQSWGSNFKNALFEEAILINI